MPILWGLYTFFTIRLVFCDGNASGACGAAKPFSPNPNLKFECKFFFFISITAGVFVASVINPLLVIIRTALFRLLSG